MNKNNQSVTARIELKITPKENGFDRIAKRIGQYPQVTSLCLMSSGGYDIALTVEGETLHDVAAFVSEVLAPMEAVVGTTTNFVLKRYKENGVIFEDETADPREVISL